MGETPTEREFLEGLRYEDKFPDPLSSTDGAGRTPEAIRIEFLEEAVRRGRERTRVLEEALGFYANEKYDHGDRAHAALAAVAVEDGGAHDGLLSGGGQDEAIKFAAAHIVVGRLKALDDREVARRILIDPEVRAALLPSAAGTLAAEPPITEREAEHEGH